jgi:hypothetical protein
LEQEHGFSSEFQGTNLSEYKTTDTHSELFNLKFNIHFRFRIYYFRSKRTFNIRIQSDSFGRDKLSEDGSVVD